MIRVLLVDDHNLVRTGMKRLLADEVGIQVVGEAATGREALRVARECEPEVILLDLIMPGMGGLEATRMLKAHEPTSGIPVIAMTADHGTRDLALEAGCVERVTKPFDLPALLGMVKLHMKAG